MVFRQRFTKLMFPHWDKVGRCSHIYVKQSAFFFSAERSKKQRERQSSSKHLLIYLFMGHHLYSCYRLTHPKQKNECESAFHNRKPPQIYQQTYRLNVYTRLKMERKKELMTMGTMFVENDFHQATTFVTLNDTKQQIGSMKKQSENGNSYQFCHRAKNAGLNKW